MATIKSFTDISQSKKLAEILPLESADMWWNYYSVTKDFGTPQIIHIDTPWVGSFNWYNEPDNVPCWSLAALLNYLKNKNKFPVIKELSDGRFKLTTYIWDGKDCIQVSIEDSIVDACYELILKLNELNLL